MYLEYSSTLSTSISMAAEARSEAAAWLGWLGLGLGVGERLGLG